MSTDRTKQADTVSRLDSHNSSVDPGDMKTLTACNQQWQHKDDRSQHVGWQISEEDKIRYECCHVSAEPALRRAAVLGEKDLRSERSVDQNVIKYQPTETTLSLGLAERRFNSVVC